MSVIWEYLSRTISGMEQFFVADKMVVLLLAIFFLFWLQEEKSVSKNGNKLLTYALVVTALLLCPLTAMLGVLYQTVFYDYEWLWSMVPVTIILSYAAVLIYDRKNENNNWRRKTVLIALFLFLLFWCGNQGILKTVGTREAEQQEKARSIVEVLKQEALEEAVVLWAPKGIMQEARRQTGVVKLVYGRDMWEPKAGAYDYETYSDTMAAAYEWMEVAEYIAEDAEPHVVEILWQRENMNAGFEKVLPEILALSVNRIVIPVEVEELFEEEFFLEIKAKGMTVEEIRIEDYILYRLK